jgi:hypothetical protein
MVILRDKTDYSSFLVVLQASAKTAPSRKAVMCFSELGPTFEGLRELMQKQEK